jgi:hypothetical protein
VPRLPRFPPLPFELQPVRGSGVLDDFLGRITGRGPFFENFVGRIVSEHLALVTNAFSAEDALDFSERQLRQVPGLLRAFIQPDPQVVGPLEALSALSTYVGVYMELEREDKIQQLTQTRVLQNLSSPKRPSSSTVSSPAKRATGGASSFAGASGGSVNGRAAGHASSPGRQSSSRWASSGQSVASARSSPSGTGSGRPRVKKFSWTSSPIQPSALPPDMCFYHVANKGTCGGMAAGSHCAKGYSHAAFPAAVLNQRGAFARWLVNESGFVFK